VGGWTDESDIMYDLMNIPIEEMTSRDNIVKILIEKSTESEDDKKKTISSG
jgi:hypothetical protein